MEINGKTYRNLESQVGYLTEVTKDISDRLEEIAANVPSKAIVEELPEVGDPTVTYYVGPKGTDPNYYYEVWVWVQEEPDGPFVWRELEDTDSIDLSGYLEKDTTESTYPKVYVKWGDGTQGLENLTQDNTYNAVVRRKADGRITVPSPSADGDCANKKYVDDNFLPIDTTTTSNAQAYVKNADGTQGMVGISGAGYAANTLVLRDATGDIRCTTGSNAASAANLGYLQTYYVKKPSGGTTFYNRLLGISSMQGDVSTFRADTSATNSVVVMRTSNANIILPDQTVNPPTNDDYAVSKRYVSQVVGQLIYHHDMVIQYTLTGDPDYVQIAAHSDNNTSTAFTGIDWHNMPLIMPDYAMYHHNSNDYLASVTKLPRGLHQDEFSEPRDGFLLTYWDGSALQNVRVNESLFNTPTVTDVVTTW